MTTDPIELLTRIAAWDGRNATDGDDIRARIYCWQHGYEYDDIMGDVGTDGEDRRQVFYSDNPGNPFEGSSISVNALPVWPTWNEPKKTQPTGYGFSAVKFALLAVAGGCAGYYICWALGWAFAAMQ